MGRFSTGGVTEMSTPEEYYCRIWTFIQSNGGPKAEVAYPIGSTMAIGKQPGDRFMLAWTDAELVLHVLTDLTLQEGNLIAVGSRDLATDAKWTITIQNPGDGKPTIVAMVSKANSSNEGDLSGNWGAEAPPREGEG
jgi:hypothetical protein